MVNKKAGKRSIEIYKNLFEICYAALVMNSGEYVRTWGMEEVHEIYVAMAYIFLGICNAV